MTNLLSFFYNRVVPKWYHPETGEKGHMAKIQMEVSDLKDQYAVRLDPDTKRAIAYASGKWPDHKHKVAPLIKEIIRDWEQWDNVRRGKTALIMYEVTRSRKMMSALFRGESPAAVEREYTMDVWEREYRAGMEESGDPFDLIVENT